jgi:hypothetical protein
MPAEFVAFAPHAFARASPHDQDRRKMSNSEFALDAAARAQFVRDGHLVVRTGLPDEFHQGVYARLEEVFDRDGNEGNNILPRVPELQQVYDDPAVTGALQSLLGPGYIMNPHRHCHLNPPGTKGQSWHKDCYVYDHNLRHPRFRWVLAFYYPQDTTADMGATGVMPGQQWYRTISNADPAQATERELALVGAAGTVSIVHFDAWHRATPNRSQRKRYMLKFQFARRTEPPHNGAAGAATWDENGALCDDVFHWLAGAGAPDAGSGNAIGAAVDALHSGTPAQRAHAADVVACSGAAGDAVAELTAALADDAEAVRLNAAYALASAGAAGLSALAQDLRREAQASEPLATAKTPDNAHGTNPTAPVAAHALASATGGTAVAADLLDDGHWLVRAMAAGALGNMGLAATEVSDRLVASAADAHWWVRRNALEALGRVAELGDAALDRVTDCIDDEDYRVRRNAAIALRGTSRVTDHTVGALARMLNDDNRYNRFYAAEALRNVAPVAPEAQQVLLDYLFTSRWCPLTDSEDRY